MANPSTTDYLTLANQVYSNNTVGQPTLAPAGYTVVASGQVDTSTGFQATAYAPLDNPNQIIIAFAGTRNVGGVETDISLSQGGNLQANNQALSFVNSIMAANSDNPNAQYYLVGHSLGGEEAQYVKEQLGDSIAGGMTFGAPGVSDSPGNLGLNDANWTNYAISSDVIANFTPASGDHYGNVVTLDAPFVAAGLSSAQAAASVAQDGNVSSIYSTLTSDGTGKGITAALESHVLDSYQQALGANVFPTDYSAIPAMVDLSVFAGANNSAPSDNGSEITVDGNAVANAVYGGQLNLGGGLTVSVVNQSGLNLQNSDVGSNIIDEGLNNTFSTNDATLQMMSNLNISINGTNNYINVTLGDNLSFAANVSNTIGGSGTPSDGSGTVINASSGDQIAVANHGDTAYGSDATFLVAAGEGELTINGNNDALGDAPGVSMANGTFAFNGSGELIEDGGNRVSFGDGSSGSVSGQSNDFTLGSGVNLSVDSNLSEDVNGSNDAINLGSGTTLIGLGDNNSISLSGDASSSSGIYLEFQGYNNSASLSDGFVNFTQGSGNDTVYGSGDTVLNGTGVNLTVDGSNNQIGFNGDPSGGGGATIGINGGGESINASFGETFDFGQNSSATISGAGSPSDGSGDVINASAGDQIAVANHGDTAFASDDTFLIAAGEGELTINGSDVVVGDAPGIGNGTLTLNGSNFDLEDGNDTFTLDGDTNVNVDGAGDVLYSDNNSIVGNSGTNFSLYGNGDTVILYENSTMRLGDDQTVYVEGSGITIDGGSGDTIIVDGSDDYVSASYSDIQYNGDDDAASGSGDDVSGDGSGDTYDGYGDGGSSGYGYGGSTESGSGYWGFSSNGLGDGKFVSQLDLNQGRAAATAKAEASWTQAGKAISVATQGSGIAPSLLEAGHWTTSTVTWSFGSTGASGTGQFSGAIQSIYQTAIEEAFQVWAGATGLTLQQVSDPSTADIQIGWNTFDTAESGALGYTSFKAQSGALLAGVSISLEDPLQQSLVAAEDGSFTYAQTSTTLEQLALHEIGHALGFAISSDPTSIMYPILGSQNLTLNAQDQAMASALYGGSTSALQSAASALAQAIASFTATDTALPNMLSVATTNQPAVQLVGAH